MTATVETTTCTIEGRLLGEPDANLSGENAVQGESGFSA